MDKENIRQLLDAYLNRTLSGAEKEMLSALVERNESEVIEVLNQMQAEQQAGSDLNAAQMAATLQQVLTSDKPEKAIVRPMTPGRRWWWVAAAVVLLIGLSIGVFRSYDGRRDSVPHIAVHTTIPAPETNRATITLADGSAMYLDSLQNGTVALQGDIQVVKLEDGRIAYESGSTEAAGEIKYNVLSNPRGSKVVSVTLADGTRVWLNAGSSLRYPVVFINKERRVALAGEGYFEVAKDHARAFHVDVGKAMVTVLGTHFNINAYSDEGTVKTTLLEGKVRISADGQSAILRPGEQAQWAGDQPLKTIKPGNIESVVAWKNGFFSFQNSSLKEIMRQLSRWYDIDVVYSGDIPVRKFGGIIPRQSSLAEVLEILEESKVHFEVNGKQIRVYP